MRDEASHSSAFFIEPGRVDGLLDSFRNYLRLLARSGLGAALRGSDVVEDTLLKAHEHFAQFHGETEAELAAWLRQILARSLFDLARRFQAAAARQVSRERSLEALLDRSSAALGNILAGNQSTPSKAVQRRELAVVLADALEELSPDYREVILLRNFEELEWDEIAHTMGRSEGALRLLWARALKQLRPLIEARL